MRDWNSHKKCKSGDLEINEANDRDSNSNINSVTIATVKIVNNNEQM